MFKNLKSLFIVDDGTSAKPKPSSSKKKPAKPAKKESKSADKPSDSAAEKHIPPPPPRTDGSGQVTEKFTTMLLKAIEANNIDGFDYIEFKQAIQGTDGMGMSEEMRYKSAFAVAKTMGVTSDYLIKTAQAYTSVLEKEQKKFLQTAKRQIQQRVGQRKDMLVKLEKAIEQKNQQIEQLKKEIEEHKQLLEKTKQEVSGAEDKILMTKADFEVSYQYIRQQLEDDISKMKQHLNNENNG